MNKWYSMTAENSDTAVYSKITLSRNIKNFRFPNRMDINERYALKNTCKAMLCDSGIMDEYGLSEIPLGEIDIVRVSSLISRGLLPDGDYSDREEKYLYLSKDESVAISVGVKDHIFISVTERGLSFENVYKRIDEIDAKISSLLPIAFNENFGYLTEDPSLLGTALRTSAVLHLPALKNFGEIPSIRESLIHIGVSISQFGNAGDYYLLTNLITLGITEREAVNNLYAICKQIIKREVEALNATDRVYIEDKSVRAKVLLTSAVKLTQEETEKYLSDINFGIKAGIISDISPATVTELWFSVSDSMIKLVSGQKDDTKRHRADYIKTILRLG